MKRYLITAFFALSIGWISVAIAGGDSPEGVARSFGPYEAVAINSSVVNDVKVEPDGNVFLQLLPDHKETELIVKISNGYFADYRVWWHGEYELVSPANQGKAPYGWTDRVNTGALYVEYWMDGNVILHLKRAN